MKTLVLKINLTFGFLFIGLCLTLFGASAARAQSALDGFNPNVNGPVLSVVVQPDGKILVGGDFTTVSPNGGAAVARNRVARFGYVHKDDLVVFRPANATWYLSNPIRRLFRYAVRTGDGRTRARRLRWRRAHRHRRFSLVQRHLVLSTKF